MATQLTLWEWKGRVVLLYLREAALCDTLVGVRAARAYRGAGSISPGSWASLAVGWPCSPLLPLPALFLQTSSSPGLLPGCSSLHCAPSCPGCCPSLSPAMALAKLGSASSSHCCFSLEGRLGCSRWGVPLLPLASSFCLGAAVPRCCAPPPSRRSHTSPEFPFLL